MSRIYWLTRAERDLPADTDWLSPGELAVVSGFTVLKRERDWLLGRWTAKQALGALPRPAGGPSEDRRIFGAEDLPRLEIRAADDGAPEPLLDGEPLPISLSISHSGGRALCAILEDKTVGCDLEQIETRSELFVQDYFTPAERALIEALPDADRTLYENLIWSAKESALKALRLGLSADTHTVDVSFPTGAHADGWRRLEVRHALDGQSFAGWWRTDGGFAITLISPPPYRVPEELS